MTWMNYKDELPDTQRAVLAFWHGAWFVAKYESERWFKDDGQYGWRLVPYELEPQYWTEIILPTK